MSYFKKIAFVLPELDMNRIWGGAAIEGYGSSFVSYDILDNEYFRSVYSKLIRFGVEPDVVNYTEITQNGAPPHVDLVSCAINYYIEAQGCVTAFWRPWRQEYAPVQIMQTHPVGVQRPLDVYEKHEMQLVEYFRANDNEAYALSTQQIHSVTKPNYHSVRKFFRWTWHSLRYEDLLENIEILTVDKE
jgi:hypothetical protein